MLGEHVLIIIALAKLTTEVFVGDTAQKPEGWIFPQVVVDGAAGYAEGTSGAGRLKIVFRESIDELGVFDLMIGNAAGGGVILGWEAAVVLAWS